MLDRVDRSLLRLRRLWTGPDREIATGVEVSTVLVCDAVAEGARSVADVAAALDVRPSTASRLVARAQDRRAVLVRPDPTDRRGRALCLTRRGETIRRRAQEVRLSYLRELTAGWSDQELSCFAALLVRFSDAVHSTPRPGITQETP